MAGRVDFFVERHILIGLIVSTEYLNEIRDVWEHRLLESPTARKVAAWCLEYYDHYQEAPGRDLEQIYFEKLKAGDLPQDLAEELEEDLLPDLSEEYEHAESFNVDYLLDKTRDYFTQRNLELHQQEVQGLMEEGRVEEAEQLQKEYTPLHKDLDADVNLADPKSLDRVKKAFSDRQKTLLEYPGAVGEMLNSQLTRDALVAFLAPEKRGKSWILLDLARRAVRQRLNVAFFQAGDMSESQQIRRLGIHLAKRSDRQEYTGNQWQPVKDCIKNQTDTCELEVRECMFGLEGEKAPSYPEEAREGLTFKQLIELHKENPDYKACHNCKKYQKDSEQLGCAWIEPVDTGPPLQQSEVKGLFEEYFVKNNRQLMISTHANSTLSVDKMDVKLDDWYRQGFVPDVIAVDYADLLEASARDFRHRQDEIWKGLRRLSEERHCLVATATQADARSYERGLLTLGNFSEDKRKYAHANAFIGLNQDPEGREKKIGIMRLNTLLAREGECNPYKVVYVLQNLKRGQPMLTSYW